MTINDRILSIYYSEMYKLNINIVIIDFKMSLNLKNTYVQVNYRGEMRTSRINVVIYQIVLS